MGFYPLYVDIEGKRCVVVGGGEVAERKVGALLECGADVLVISPELTDKLAELGRRGHIRVAERGYELGDVAGAVLVIAATSDSELNARVHAEAVENKIPVNVVDAPELCTFIVPSIVRRGDLVLSVSTSGACPALAKKIRQQLEKEFGQEFEDYCEVLKNFRAENADKYEKPEDRIRALVKLIDSDLLELIKEGKIQEVEERVRSCK